MVDIVVRFKDGTFVTMDKVANYYLDESCTQYILAKGDQRVLIPAENVLYIAPEDEVEYFVN